MFEPRDRHGAQVCNANRNCQHDPATSFAAQAGRCIHRLLDVAVLLANSTLRTRLYNPPSWYVWTVSCAEFPRHDFDIKLEAGHAHLQR